jgi:hypothetical protein
MNRIKSLFFLVALLVAPLLASAQDIGVEMADKLRSNGKIYVVVACVFVIFAGIIIFMIMLDRKLRKLEKIQRLEDKNRA